LQIRFALTSNAGKADFKGLEIESSLRAGENLIAGGDRLILSGSLGYLDAKFKEFASVVAFEPDGTPIVPADERDVSDFREVQNTPKWTASGTIEYEIPVASGRLNFNTTLSYRSGSQQFEIAVPALDQGGFALWDANLVWRAPGGRWTLGVHGKNLTGKKYIVSGYNFYNQNPFTGEFILPNGQPGLSSAVGLEGVLTRFYGKPRRTSRHIARRVCPTMGKSVGKPRHAGDRTAHNLSPTMGKSVGKPRQKRPARGIDAPCRALGAARRGLERMRYATAFSPLR